MIGSLTIPKAWHLTVLLALFFITGCDSSPPDPAEEDPPASPTPEMGAPAGATSDPLPDEEARQLMESLLDLESEALQTVLESGDERFVAVLLELMRAHQIGIVEGSYNDIIETLESLSDQDFSRTGRLG